MPPPAVSLLLLEPPSPAMAPVPAPMWRISPSTGTRSAVKMS